VRIVCDEDIEDQVGSERTGRFDGTPSKFNSFSMILTIHLEKKTTKTKTTSGRTTEWRPLARPLVTSCGGASVYLSISCHTTRRRC